MQITVEHHPHVVLSQLVDHLLHMMDRGEGLLDGVFVLSVQITAGQVTPGVADNHSVRVEHWNNLEDEQLPQRLGSLSVAGEVMEDSSHHPGGGGLSGVDPGSDDDRCNM